MDGIDLIALSKTLGVLILIAAGQTVALEQIFDTPWYRKWFGWGEDGKGSRLFKTFELRPYISTALGIYICWLKDIQFPGPAISTGSHDADAALFGVIFAGFLVGGGTKGIKKMMKDAAGTAQEVVEDAKKLNR